MKNKFRLICLLCIAVISTNSFAQDSKQEVLKVVNEFFNTMKNKDSLAFNNLFIENAQAYSIRKIGDSILIRNSILKARDSKSVLKERLREEEITIQINNNIAAVLAYYDFWINDEHSHCGYEVFTLLKKNSEWKIASLTYSVEKDSCNN